MKKVHELKIEPKYYEQVFLGRKTFEIRKNDRDFKVLDTLILKEYDKDIRAYTGLELARTITYIFEGGEYGLESGYVVISIQ